MRRRGIFTIVFAMAAIVSACAQNGGTYTVTGCLSDSNSEGKTIYIRPVDSMNAIDSTIVADGRFFFTGHIGKPEFCRIDIGYNVYANFILESGNIRVDMTNHNSPSGTPLNDKMKALDAKRRPKHPTIEEEERLCKQSDRLFAEHSNDALGYYLLVCSDYFRWRGDADKERIIDRLGPWLKSKTIVQATIMPRIKARKATAAGRMFTDIMGVDTKGNPKMLSEYVGHGRYVLMNMWAGWCRPCREETANLAILNDKFGKQGLTVVGMFVWDDHENMEKTMDAEGITWPQIADINGVAAKTYGVSIIPQIILFGPDGRIIARDLHGKEMIEKVSNLFE